MTILERNVNGITIGQRPSDGYMNGTAMCVSHNKDISDWLKTGETWDLATALAEDLNIEPIKPKNHKSGNSVFTRVSATYPILVIVRRGSPETGGGSWLHPDLALQLAQWCSPRFAIQVSRWLREWVIFNAEHKEQVQKITKIRIEGKETRRQLTDAIASFIVRHPDLSENDKKWMYTNASEAVNLQVFGRRANQLCKDIKAHRSELREALSPQELLLVQEVEDTAMRLIDSFDVHPLRAVKDAASRLLIPKQTRQHPLV